MERIVVLDDDKNIVSLLEEVLKEEGYNVETFLDPIDFIGYAKDNDVDLLIVDLQLPGMNGIEVVGELKRIQPGCKVIMITGYPSIQSTIGALRQGVSDYLIKPFNIDSIKKTIQKVLSSKEEKLSFPKYEEEKDVPFIPIRIYIDNRTSLYVIETNIEYLYKNGKIDNITYNLLRTHINRLKGLESGERFNLRELCHSVIDSFIGIIRRNNIKILCEVEEIELNGKYFFERAFRELLINAIEHVINLDERVIKVYLKKYDDGLYLIIENNGSLKNDIKEKMFDCFYTTKKGHIGIGLNLAVYYLKRINMSIKVINNCEGVCLGILIEKGG